MCCGVGNNVVLGIIVINGKEQNGKTRIVCTELNKKKIVAAMMKKGNRWRM